MSEPQLPPPAPEEKKAVSWPLVLNLGLLLVVAGFSGGDVGAISSSVFGLVIINGLAALIVSISGGRMHYVIAFVLSCLALLLIGLGVCALIISNAGFGGGH
ncbi:hypothetical protein E4631_11140 [Hymenobacter sp. UV11]|uniref:hypothetical protein n=1 Tax=Hymenobacter sp. UV11 TaxID=1849735 RepID=UPI001075FBD4|nr:hypothetical protein [Hymenobacter sp. UV11]TDN40431.1 hypothetical protein A8B98_13415 [Hymenobacter sp. UV11]TFZ66562.1 hypothetical protein E4631_11140 [Hymenobacter sp. UV11]